MAEISESSRERDVRSRGNVLAMLGGAIAGAVAGGLGRPEQALGGHDETNVLHLGESNISPADTTTILTGDTPNHVLAIFNERESEQGAAIIGDAHTGDGTHGAIEGRNDADGGVGVAGFSTVPGFSALGNGIGVSGFSGSGRGVSGQTETGTGIGGFSGTGVGVSADIGESGNAVEAFTPLGIGVRGSALQGNGVAGHCDHPEGVGTSGASTDGIGVHATSQNGQALRVEGRAAFTTAGSGTVPQGQNSVFVANAAVTAASHVSVTLVSNPGIRLVHWVEKSPGSGFTVRMTPAPANQRPTTAFTYLIVEAAA